MRTRNPTMSLRTAQISIYVLEVPIVHPLHQTKVTFAYEVDSRYLLLEQVLLVAFRTYLSGTCHGVGESLKRRSTTKYPLTLFSLIQLLHFSPSQYDMATAGEVAYNVAVFISSLFLLEFGADKLVDHAAIVARRTGVPATVVALLTAGAEWEEVTLPYPQLWPFLSYR